MSDALDDITESLQKLFDNGIVGVDFTLTREKWIEYALPDAAGFQMDLPMKGGNMTVMLWRADEESADESDVPVTKDMN
jgi:hypothetical protein